jgi:hypothetical protein
MRLFPLFGGVFRVSQGKTNCLRLFEGGAGTALWYKENDANLMVELHLTIRRVRLFLAHDSFVAIQNSLFAKELR